MKKTEGFLETLQKDTVAKVLRNIELLEKFRYQLPMPYSKKIRNNLYELRIRGKQEVRLFYTFYKEKIILLHGFVKKTGKTPKTEIDKAITYVLYINNEKLP